MDEITDEDRPAEKKRSGIPGKAAAFSEEVTHLVYALYGIQAKDAEKAKPYVQQLKALFSHPSAPGSLELMGYKDSEGYFVEVFLAYWTDVAAYRDWAEQPSVAGWWQELPLDPASELGFWREVMTPHKDHYQYGNGNANLNGLAKLGHSIDSTNFGYWGSYRDRVPASLHDRFRPDSMEVPPRTIRDTLGKRLSVKAPNNTCYIREGQAWELADAAELAIWEEQMANRVDSWIDILGADPQKTGCFSLRACREQHVLTGDAKKEQSQIAFLVSLKHIEAAARTVRQHLELKDAYMRMVSAPGFVPKMNVWVEMCILKDGDLETEYVNCHPMTGFLPYYEPQAL